MNDLIAIRFITLAKNLNRVIVKVGTCLMPQRRLKKYQDDQIKELKQRLADWSIPSSALNIVHDAASASLKEVKALTEYEDGKVSRLLTVIAFLSAVVAATFTRFASEYDWPEIIDYSESISWWLPFLTYGLFFLYLICVTAAVLLLLWAIRPKFNLPLSWKGQPADSLPASMLFYERILEVGASKWGEAFIQSTDDDGGALKAHYTKCYIVESYLVAEKVAYKLRVAEKGVAGLIVAIIILFAYFSCFALTAYLVNIPACDGCNASLNDFFA